MFLSALPLLPVVSVHSAPSVCPYRPLVPPAAASVSSAVSALLSFCTGSHCLRALHCLSSSSGPSCLPCYVCTAADAPALISCVSESDTCICSGSLICSRSGHLIFPEIKMATNTPLCFSWFSAAVRWMCCDLLHADAMMAAPAAVRSSCSLCLHSLLLSAINSVRIANRFYFLIFLKIFSRFVSRLYTPTLFFRGFLQHLSFLVQLPVSVCFLVLLDHSLNASLIQQHLNRFVISLVALAP